VKVTDPSFRERKTEVQTDSFDVYFLAHPQNQSGPPNIQVVSARAFSIDVTLFVGYSLPHSCSRCDWDMKTGWVSRLLAPAAYASAKIQSIVITRPYLRGFRRNLLKG
jgi:hypothetical protein